MSDCNYADECPFFKNEINPAPENRDALIDDYCKKNPLHCARAMVYDALGSGKAGDDLMPDNKVAAYAAIAVG